MKWRNAFSVFATEKYDSGLKENVTTHNAAVWDRMVAVANRKSSSFLRDENFTLVKLLHKTVRLWIHSVDRNWGSSHCREDGRVSFYVVWAYIEKACRSTGKEGYPYEI